MSFSAIEYIMAQDISPPSTKFVAVVLAFHMNRESLLCCPSQSVLSEECSIKTRQVRNHLVKLESLGIIRREHRQRDKGELRGTRTTDSYELIGFADALEKMKSAANSDRQQEATNPENGGLPTSGNELPVAGEASGNELPVGGGATGNVGYELPAIHCLAEPKGEPKDSTTTIADTDSELEPKSHANRESESSPKKRVGEARKAFEAFKALATRLGLGEPSRLQFSNERRRVINARLKDCGGLEGWNEALAMLEASDFCCGRNGSDWKITLTNLLQQKTFTRLREGDYSNEAMAWKLRPKDGGGEPEGRDRFKGLLSPEQLSETFDADSPEGAQ